MRCMYGSTFLGTKIVTDLMQMPFENFTDNWKEGYWSKESNITFVGFFGNGDHVHIE